jgi:N-acetylglutamate synthase-like GNAT family acetyltransferase
MRHNPQICCLIVVHVRRDSQPRLNLSPGMMRLSVGTIGILMQNILIAAFSDADQRGVLNVILPIQQQEFGIAITEADQPDLTNVPQFYQTGTGGFWVARSKDEVVGTVGLKDIGAGQAALRKMFVAAPFRGRELGVASKLLDALLAHARAQDISEIFLGTTEKFLAAHRFYEKQGFQELQKAALPKAFPIMAVDSKFYILSL